jgi:tetratricopeptide (TPR) repeat protein
LSLQVSAQQVDLNRLLSQGSAAYDAKDYEKAIEALSQVIKAAPDSPGETTVYKLGYAYYFTLKHQEAVDTFEMALKKYPKSQFVPEYHFVIGRTLLQLGDDKIDAALGHLASADAAPEFAEEARFLAAEAYIKKGDTDKAANLLQAAMKAKASGPSVLRATLQLVDLYLESDKLKEAKSMLRDLENSPGYADVIVTVNNRFVKIGDIHLEAQAYAEALEAYSSVRPRAQVIAIQVERLDQMRSLKGDFEKRIAAATKSKEKLPRGYEEKAATLALMIQNTDQVLGELRTMEDYDATIQYRVGRCYFNMERFWPASVAFEVVSNDNPKSADAPTSMFGAIVCQWKLERSAAARLLCDTYLERYPAERHAEQVAELKGTLLVQDGLNEEAVSFLKPIVEKSAAPAREKLLALLAKARFQGGMYNEAAADYDTLRKDFAASPDFEEYTYRRALCDFLRNDYEATIKSFDAYERDFLTGQFRADIRYRRGIIQLALKQYDKLIASMEDLLRDPASQNYAGQIHTLLADAWSAKGDDTKAATEYANAVRKANGDETVIMYSLEMATNLLRSARRWPELQALWDDFIKNNPKHPMVLRGVAELSKLLQRDKKIDEARALLAGQIISEINNVRSEYVEMLISQLAGLYLPPRSVKKDAPAPDIDKIEEEFVKMLEIPEDKRTPAYLARVLFAKSELARMMKDAPRNQRNLNAIANSCNPEDLGPILLSIVGQFLMDDNQPDKAIPLFTRLRDAFPQSPFSDAAPVGLGRIALSKKDYNEALAQFDYAITRSVGAGMMKEATFGKAQALKGQLKREEAKKLFEEIIGNKDWRGEEKAGSIFELGEIAAETGDKGVAHAYYQKVYISHGAYPQYVAKSYFRAYEMLKGVGKLDEAMATLREFIKNPKWKDTPEWKKAREIIRE